MYIDANLVVSGDRSDAGVWTGQVIEDDELSTYSIDLDAIKNLSKGKQLYMVIIIDTAFTTCTSVNFQVVTDEDEALGTSLTVQMETGVLARTSLTLNRAPIVIPIGSALGTEQQYLGLRYVLATPGSDTGVVIAFVAFDTP